MAAPIGDTTSIPPGVAVYLKMTRTESQPLTVVPNAVRPRSAPLKNSLRRSSGDPKGEKSSSRHELFSSHSRVEQLSIHVQCKHRTSRRDHQIRNCLRLACVSDSVEGSRKLQKDQVGHILSHTGQGNCCCWRRWPQDGYRAVKLQDNPRPVPLAVQRASRKDLYEAQHVPAVLSGTTIPGAASLVLELQFLRLLL